MASHVKLANISASTVAGALKDSAAVSSAAVTSAGAPATAAAGVVQPRLLLLLLRVSGSGH